MTSDDYRSHLTTLGLSQQAAGRWLSVSPKTAQNYATKGPSGPAARAIEMRIHCETALRVLDAAGMSDRIAYHEIQSSLSPVRHSDLNVAVGLPNV